MDNWLVDVAFRDLGTNFLLPDVMDTLLEFDFNHADLKFVERNSFNVKSLPATWGRLSEHLRSLVEDSDSKNRFHSSFALRQRLIHSLIRSWSLHQNIDESTNVWNEINLEFDKSALYLKEYRQVSIQRIKFKSAGGDCHGLLRIPQDLNKNKLDVLVVLPGMDMTKEYFPSLAGAHTDSRDFATLSIDPPGHGYSFLNGTRLSARNIDDLLSVVIDWLGGESLHDFVVGQIGILGIGTSSTYAFRAGIDNDSLAVVAGFEGGFLFKVKETLGEQSSMRLKKLAKMMDCNTEQVLEHLSDLSLDKCQARLKIPAIFTVGEHDDLFPKNQVPEFLSLLESNYALNFYEGEGHVLGKVINESLMTILDQIEDCFQGRPGNLMGMQVIRRRN